MNKFSLVAVAALTLVSAHAMAAGATFGFNVKATLVSACKVNTAATDMTFAYTAFQAGNATGTGFTSLVVECTRSIAVPTIMLDGGALGAGATSTSTVGGLQYTLNVAAGVAGTKGTAASSSTIGSGDLFSYAVTGTMPGAQAGDPTQPLSVARTLTLQY